MIGHALPVYHGYASQYGHGLGNVLGGLVRAALPLVGKFAKSAGAKLLETGLDVVGNALKKKKVSKRSKSNTKQKTHHVKRSTPHTKITHKRKMPPGQRTSRPAKLKATKARDIFSK